MNAAISEWTWTLFEMLLRTGVVTTVILLAALVGVRFRRGASAAVRHRIWFAAVVGCWAVPLVIVFVPASMVSLPAVPAEVSLPAETPIAKSREVSPTPPIDTAAADVPPMHSEPNPLPADVELASEGATEPIHIAKEMRGQSVSVPPHRPQLSPHNRSTETKTIAPPRRKTASQPTVSGIGRWLFSSSYPSWIVAAWLFVAAGLILRLLRARQAAKRMVRESTPVADQATLTLLNEICFEMQVRARVRIRFSKTVDVPLIAGIVKPVLLLPEEARDWSRERLAVVMRHELAHIVRRDVLSQLLADLGTAIEWYQPLLWYASRRLRVEREFACDDRVLQMGTPACDYADQLLHVASQAVLSRRHSPASVSMAGRSTVEHRIRSILNPNTNRNPLGRFGTAVLIFSGAVLLLTAAFLTPTFSMASPEPEETTTQTHPSEHRASPAEPSQVVIAASPQEETASAKQVVKNPQDYLSGQVVDESGKPVPKVEVILEDYQKFPKATTTDAEGRFEFEVPATSARDRYLAAKKDQGRQLGALLLPSEVPEEGFHNLTLTLKQAKEAIVRVVDDKGRPLPNAAVGVLADYRDAGAARTDKEGIGKVFIPQDAEIKQVYAMKESLGFDYKSFTVPRDRRNDKNYVKPVFPAEGVTLTLDGVQPLAVKMLTTDGTPIPNISVYPWYFKKEGETDDLNLSFLMARQNIAQQTDKNGIVRFPWVPHWQKSRVTIWPKTDEFVHQRAMYDPATGNGTLEMRLDRLVPMRGKVVLPDGKAAGGIKIDVAGAGYQFDDFRSSVTTDDDGTFKVLAAPNKVYLLVVKDQKWAAEPLTGFALWPNKPIDNLEFKLRPTTRIHGRVTIGSDKKPVSDLRITSYQYGADAHNLKGVKLPNPEDSNTWVQPMVFYNATTDAEGRYEYFVGPGQFNIWGPNQNKIQKFEIKDETEKTFDFDMPRPEKGILKGLVVAGDPPQPVANAKVSGIVRSPRARDINAVTNKDGWFEVERDLHLTALDVESADGKLGALLQVDADTKEIKIPLKPLASASGTLVDDKTGDSLADREITYGILVYDTEKDDGPFRISFGGKTTTGANGHFALERLVPGGDYHIDVTIEKNRSWRTVGKVQPKDATAIDLGKLKLTPAYKPPTIHERIAAAFANKRTPIERYESALSDIKLSRQRIVLLLADPAGEAAKQFMTLRYENEEIRDAFNEFRLIAVDSAPTNEGSIKPLREKLQQNLGEDAAKFFVIVVDEKGRRIDSLKTGDVTSGTAIDQKKVLAFLKKNTQPPLDARKLLKEALAQAKRENKRVIVQETATWCGPCWMLSRFLDKHRDVWERDFLWIKMDHRWTGARELMKEFREDAEAGIPWWAILDAAGKKLATSNQPDGDNIGFPSTPAGIKHFRAMLKQSAQRMTAEQIDELAGDLEKED